MWVLVFASLLAYGVTMLRRQTAVVRRPAAAQSRRRHYSPRLNDAAGVARGTVG